jgi:hypothetical protein
MKCTGITFPVLTSLQKTSLILESFHAGGQLSDLILEALRVAEEIDEYLPLPSHLMGTILKYLKSILQIICSLLY